MKKNKRLLTVEILKTLKFKLHMHINGGNKYSKRVDTNEEWKLAISTETEGSPNYNLTSKELYMMDNHNVVMDMLKKPLRLESFIEAYNKNSTQGPQ